MDLAEVTQALALGGKTGSLVVAFAVGEGEMFEMGRLVHGSFGGRTGEGPHPTSQRGPQASFRFNQMGRSELASLPKTISRGVDQLLMSIAAGIDESGTGSGPIQTVPVISRKEG